jgi:hypothetical protein
MTNRILLIEIIVAGLVLTFILIQTIIRTKNKIKQISSIKTNNYDDDNPYEGLRKMAFKRNLQELGLSLSDKEIFGVIMDWDIGHGIVTLVAYKTGDASMYLSSGGGIIGGGPNPNVNGAAKLFVDQSKKYFEKSQRMYAIPLPEKDSVRFYFLTTKGKFCVQEKLEKIENHSSPYVDYFNEANNLIAELRKTIENKK